MWITRDLDNTLTLFKSKPERQDNCFWKDTNWLTSDNFMFLDDALFPKLKWEDEPIEVELIPVLRTTKPSFIKSGYPSKLVDEHFDELV